MSLSKNTYRGYIGITTTSPGVFGIDELVFSPPTVVSTSSADAAASITLPSGILAGQTILIFAGSRQDIATPSGYTLINSYQQSVGGTKPSLATFYKIANGTEGGTSLSVLADNSVIGCAVINKSISINVPGTAVNANSNTTTVSSITPSSNSLVFLFSVCDQNSNDPSNTGGFTNVVIDGANDGGGGAKELYVWSKISDGTATGNVSVTWGNTRTSSVLFSITK
jgi:hypothetical protein